MIVYTDQPYTFVLTIELQWMESQRKLLQFSMQYWKNRPPEDFLKVQQEFANLKTEEIMQKVLENAKSVLNDEKFNFPSVKDLPRPSRDDIIRFQEVNKLERYILFLILYSVSELKIKVRNWSAICWKWEIIVDLLNGNVQ